ncbi:structural maintenance of chromosomes protein 6B-like [Senna tora]|uniref:Structural maintenance of chromosomes protein 6B-like n=1 Tax=Senna tora TaxID=362788 RepID=A0A834TLP8_9FABA|nr:structural maintenance of chromosomes protein 6B-like [Senna tora]
MGKAVRPKQEGGLALCDVHAFNEALMAKQIWRLKHPRQSTIKSKNRGATCHRTPPSLLTSPRRRRRVVEHYRWSSIDREHRRSSIACTISI